MTVPRQWNSTLPIRKSRLSPGGTPRTRKPRKPSEFARIYHSRKRVAWIKARPCVICGMGPCDNAHTENGGMSRKAGYETIVPLCCMPADHPFGPGYSRGHHGLLHQIGVKTFERQYGVDLKALAAATQAAWLTYTGVAA